MTSDVVSVSQADGVAVLTIDNPPVNALSAAVLHGLIGALEQLAGDRSIGAIVLSAAGRTFVAGADLGELQSILGDIEAARRHVGSTDKLFALLGRQPQPVIAAVAAPALGGGFELALACDVIVVESSAFFQLPEVDLALMPGAGGTQRLTNRIGKHRTVEAILTARRISAAEAGAWGLATVVGAGASLDEATALAARMARQPRSAVTAALTAIRHEAESAMASGLHLEQEQFLGVLAGDDARRGVEAFFASRRR